MPAAISYAWETYNWLQPFTNKAIAAFPPSTPAPMPANTAPGTFVLNSALLVGGAVTASSLTVSGTATFAGVTATSLAVSGNVGFYGTAAQAKKTVTGAKGSNAALGSLLTQLAALGLITDSSTA